MLQSRWSSALLASTGPTLSQSLFDADQVASSCLSSATSIVVPTPAAMGSPVIADWTQLSGVMRELESNWSDCSAVPESCQPLVSFLKVPEKGLPVINGIEAWLNAVDHWTEAARFLNVPIDCVGIPLLAPISYNQHLYQMSPRWVLQKHVACAACAVHQGVMLTLCWSTQDVSRSAARSAHFAPLLTCTRWYH